MTRERLASAGHDPELAILAELEERIRLLAEQRMATDGRRAADDVRVAPTDVASTADAPQRRRPRRPDAGRIVRRALVLVGLVGLVGSAAVATRSLVDDDGDPSLRTTRAVEIGGGHVRGETWRLSAARRGTDVCDALLVEGTVATRCDEPPRRDQVFLDGVLSPGSRWVAGLTGPQVRRVALEIGGTRRIVVTRPVADPGAARRADLPRGLRWFVAAFPREHGGGVAPARVTPLARSR